MKAFVVIIAMASLLLSMTLVIMGSVSGSAREPGVVKIGVIDLQEIADRTEIGKETQNRVREFYDRKKRDLEAREMALVSEAAELENQRAVLSSEAYAVKKNSLEQRQLALQQERESAEMELNKLRQSELDRFANAVGPVIEALGRELEYTVILDRRNGVFYFDKNSDVTALVIERINRGDVKQ